jgi:hypothetical protein
VALTSNFRRTVQARAQRDAAFREGLLSEALENLLSGDVAVGKELLRDYINATIGFPKVAVRTKTHVKTLHQMFGPNGNPTANKLFESVAYLQRSRVFDLRFGQAELRSAYRSPGTHVRARLSLVRQRRFQDLSLLPER